MLKNKALEITIFIRSIVDLMILIACFCMVLHYLCYVGIINADMILDTNSHKPTIKEYISVLLAFFAGVLEFEFALYLITLIFGF